jgi:hypothetical protein
VSAFLFPHSLKMCRKDIAEDWRKNRKENEELDADTEQAIPIRQRELRTMANVSEQDSWDSGRC